MKTKSFFFLNLVGLMLSFSSCQRDKNDVWDDTKSAGRHMSRGIRALAGQYGDSRQIQSRDQFECIDDQNGYQTVNYEYVPLEDANCQDMGSAEMMAPPPRETPGEAGSSIPGIEAFSDPSTMPHLAGIFRPIYFEYNSNLVKGEDNLQVVQNVANYLRRNPNTSVFVEGHADERGPQSYNFALGSRRANTVRNMLVSEGVNPDRLFTISYGKERPLVIEHHEEAWSKNRRVEFKIYERR